MTLQLYDLALSDIDVRPSPYCWLVKYALLHKGLKFETIPLRFTEKENYPDPEHGQLPILKDGDQVICDSLNIIAYLEKHHANDPLTSTKGERAAVDFYLAWMGAILYPALGPMLMARVHSAAHEDDREYFRTAREARFGKTLEELSSIPGQREKTEAALEMLAAPLARNKYLGGDFPNLADYAVFGVFMWQRTVCSETLYEAPQAVDAWQERMLDLYDGYGRKAARAS